MRFREKITKTLPSLLILFLIVLGTNILEQYLNLKLQSEMRSESSSFFLVVFFIIFSSLISVFFQQAAFLTNVEYLQPLTQFPLRTRYIDLIKENLKAIGSASLWMFLFIIPGIIRWIQYSFLPFIVFLNPEYQNGDSEVLSFSKSIVKNISWKFYFWWILFNCIIPIILSIFGGGYESFNHTPGSALLLSFIEAAIFWTWMLILWDSYDKNYTKAKL